MRSIKQKKKVGKSMHLLKIGHRKLENIRKEKRELHIHCKKEQKDIPFGQPNIQGRRNIYQGITQKHAKMFFLMQAEKDQKQRIAMLEKVEAFKKENEQVKDVHVVGKSMFATVGVKTSVNNLEHFKEQLKELEEKNERAKAHNKSKKHPKMKTFGAKITKLKNKIATLEKMKEQDEHKKISQKSQHLIDAKKVNQWAKKPIYFFVVGLKKVALELNEEGNFMISKRYPVKTKEEEQFVQELLQ